MTPVLLYCRFVGGSSRGFATSRNPLFRRPCFLIGERLSWPSGALISPGSDLRHGQQATARATWNRAQCPYLVDSERYKPWCAIGYAVEIDAYAREDASGQHVRYCVGCGPDAVALLDRRGLHLHRCVKEGRRLPENGRVPGAAILPGSRRRPSPAHRSAIRCSEDPAGTANRQNSAPRYQLLSHRAGIQCSIFQNP